MPATIEGGNSGGGGGGGGSGDVSGPISSTDNAIARWDGTTGDLIQDSGVIVSDTNYFSWPNAGAAVVAGDYSFGRDNTATNLLRQNAPTGAGHIFSINGSPLLLLTATATTHLVSSTVTAGTAVQPNSYLLTHSPGGASTAVLAGWTFAATTDANNFTMSRLESVRATATFQGDSTIQNLIAFRGKCINATGDAGTVVNAIVLKVETADTTAFITNNIGIDIEDFTTDGANQLPILFRGSNAENAINWGTDANQVRIYRGANDVLATDDLLQFNTGIAFTAAQYQIGRDNAGTNLFGFNVPTSSSWYWSINNVKKYAMDTASFSPSANDGAALGTTALNWSDFFIASGGVINWNNGDVTITHATDQLTFAGAANGFRFSSRLEEGKGADVASANDLTLGGDGNAFGITGTTTINAITSTNWQSGSIVTLIFAGATTVKHNTAGGAGTAKIFLAASTDLTTAANTILGLVYDGTQWQETFRKVA